MSHEKGKNVVSLDSRRKKRMVGELLKKEGTCDSAAPEAEEISKTARIARLMAQPKTTRLSPPPRISFAAESRMKVSRPQREVEVSDYAIRVAVLTFVSAAGSFLLGAKMLNEFGAVLLGASYLATVSSIGTLLGVLRRKRTKRW